MRAPLLLAALVGCVRAIPLGDDFAIVAPVDAALTFDAARPDAPDAPDAPDGAADRPEVSALPEGTVAGLALGERHTCAWRSDGRVWCWGANDHGQLGDGSTTRRLTPTRVEGLRDVTLVVTGAEHTCARTATGRVWCWGSGADGRLFSADASDRTAPYDTGLDATALAAGTAHTCAATSAALRCAGADVEGAPVLPAAVRALAAGGAFTCAQLADGSLWCWGRNAEGQLGRGSLSPREGPARVALDAVTAIVAGAQHACATAGGATWCWGDRAAGQLGDGVVGAALATPARVDAWQANPLAAGAGFTCALQGSAVSCAGANEAGQLGDGSTAARALPTMPVMGFVRTRLTAVAAGARHACAVVVDDSLWCWGDGADGQLGDGALGARPLLTRVRW